MKILQVISSLRTGGAEKLVVQLTSALKAMGHQVDVALFDGLETDLKRNLEETGCKIFSFSKSKSMNSLKSIYYPWHIFKLARIMKGYDIVHTHNTTPQLFAAIARIGRKSPVLVTTEHSTFNRRRNMRIFRAIDRWMYRKYASVICISDIARSKLTEYLGTGRNICVINNGVDINAFSRAEADPCLRKGSRPHVVVMVAAMRAEKDHPTLIRAIWQLGSQYELWLAGDGVMRESLENLVRELSVEDRVKFLGWRKDIPQILKSADVVAMASHYEGLSLSSIEGMAVSKPFVASDVDGLREVVQGAGVLVSEADVAGFASAIEKLCTDPVWAAQVAQNCMKRAMQYDFQTMAASYNKVYEGLIKEKDNAPRAGGTPSADDAWIE